MKLKPNITWVILSANATTNIITIAQYLNNSAYTESFNIPTPYNLYVNPDINSSFYLEQDPIFLVYFKNAGDYIEKNKTYYIRPLTYVTCSVHETEADARSLTNAVSLSGFPGGFMYRVHTGGGGIRPATKFYATPKQCCPELDPIFQIPYYTHCNVTFKNYNIDCVLSDRGSIIPLYYDSSFGYFSGAILNFSTAEGLRALFVGIKIYIQNEIKRIEIKVAKGASNDLGTFMDVFPGVFDGTLSQSYTGTLNGTSYEGANQVSYEFTTQASLPSTANLYLKQASFSNGQTIIYDYIQSKTKHDLPTSLGLGDINEVLTFNPETRCYESELKNYYEIPGRFTVPLVFYEENNTPFVTRKPVVYGYPDYFYVGPANASKEIYFDSATNVFKSNYVIQPKNQPLIPDGQIVITYSFTASALYPYVSYYANLFSSDIEPFYRSNFFYIGSNEPSSFLTI